MSIIYVNSIVSHCFTVKGMPRQGARVRRGPDWGKGGSVSLPDTNGGIWNCIPRDDSRWINNVC